MANLNKVLLIGNLTRDPQLSYLPSQTPVVEFGLAMNRRWTSQDGTKRDETCFVDCRCYGRPAETINKYLRKGQPLFVEGRLQFDTWTSPEGQRRSKHRVVVESFQFLGTPSRTATGTPAEAAGAPETPVDSRPAAQFEEFESSPATGGGPEDDIPF